MKLWLGALLTTVSIVFLAPTGAAGAGGDDATASSHPFTEAAAHDAARALARKFTRGSPKVDTMAMEGCGRLSERRVDCYAVARGRTATTRTKCRLRIAVQAVNRHPKARLARLRCGTLSTLLLTASRAREALLSKGTELADKPVTLSIFHRRGRSRFIGMVEWVGRQSPAGMSEECFALLYATISPAGRLHTPLLEAGCEPPAA
jgi:hypothetical protein